MTISPETMENFWRLSPETLAAHCDIDRFLADSDLVAMAQNLSLAEDE